MEDKFCQLVPVLAIQIIFRLFFKGAFFQRCINYAGICFLYVTKIKMGKVNSKIILRKIWFFLLIYLLVWKPRKTGLESPTRPGKTSTGRSTICSWMVFQSTVVLVNKNHRIQGCLHTLVVSQWFTFVTRNELGDSPAYLSWFLRTRFGIFITFAT